MKFDMERNVLNTNASGKTILFHSPNSHKSWPVELQNAFPEFNVRTEYKDVDPEDVVAAVVWNPPDGMLNALPKLRLIQVMGAGVEKLLAKPLPNGVPVARLVDPGLAVRMTEYVLMHSLALHRRMPELRQAQEDRRWVYLQPVPPSETCIGIMGMGVLGQSCAKSLISTGFDVIGWSKSAKNDLKFPCYIGSSELDTFKKAADIIVVLLPLTQDTEDLLDRHFFSGLKKEAALINVGRGKLLVEDALLAALDAGSLRHAVLDVFRTEPLPADHPFWDHSRITITPHNSSSTHPATALSQVVENIRRAIRGERR